jgi:two-component sensor histidine kinase
MFTVIITVSSKDTGNRFVITTEALALHEAEARVIAFSNIHEDLLMDANVLTVDINENLDRFRFVSIKPK